MATYVLTIAGVTKQMRYGSLRLTRRANGRSILECDLVSLDATYRPDPYDEVILTEDGTRIFGGFIEAPSENGFGPMVLPIATRISAIDFDAYIDRRIVNVSIGAGTLKAALQALVPYLTDYGVTLDGAQVNGPNLDAQVFTYQPLRQALEQLSTLTDYVYEIDENKVLRMYAPSAASAPWDITTYDGHTIGDVTVEAPRDDYYNRVILLFGSGLADVTDSFTGDGSTQDFALRYFPASNPTTVNVGGVDYPIGIFGVDLIEWTYEAATNELHHAGSPPIGLGVAIHCTFSAQFPGVSIATDAGEVALNGLIERTVTVPGVFNAGVAASLAAAHLGRGVRHPRRARYTTLTAGLKPGQTQTITIAERDLSGTWMIEEIAVTQPGPVEYAVTAVEGSAPVNGRWSDLYQQWSGTSGGAAQATALPSGGLSGNGTVGTLAKWSTTSSITDSIVLESGSAINIVGQARVTRAYSNTIADGSYLSLDNADASRRWSLDPDASNNLRLCYWDGATWASQVTVSATSSIGAPANLTLAPVGDLVLDPTGNDVLPNLGYDINLGMLTKKFLTLHAAELWVETLVAHDTIATIGGRVLIGPTTTLTADLAAAATSIVVKHNQLASGDRVYLEANGAVEFMAITSAPSGGGPYTYTVTRNLDGSGANDWTAGDAVFNTGTTGDGFIDLYSMRGVKAGTEYGPTIVGNIRNSATYNDWTPRWAIGNLNGLYGYSADTYGAAFGVPTAAWVKIDPTNGIRIGHNATTKISLDASGNASFSGAITAASGTIGGWTIESTYLAKDTGTANTSAGLSPTDYPFYAGATFAGRASAPFRVTPAGALTATSATLTGSLTASGSITIGAYPNCIVYGSAYLYGTSGTNMAMECGAFTVSGRIYATSGVQIGNSGSLQVLGSSSVDIQCASIYAGAMSTSGISGGVIFMSSGYLYRCTDGVTADHQVWGSDSQWHSMRFNNGVLYEWTAW